MAGYSTVYDGILFVEGAEEDCQVICKVSKDLGGLSQFKTLNDVKKGLAVVAKNKNGNAIVEFKYGQKARFFSVDQTNYFGNGVVVALSEERYNQIIDKINARK